MVNDTSAIGKTTIYLKGQTISKVTQVVPLNIWVCGNETISKTLAEPIEIVLKKEDPDHIIPWYELNEMFIFSNQTVGHDLCHNETLEIYDEICNKN